MAKRPNTPAPARKPKAGVTTTAAIVEEMLLAAQQRGTDSMETGRFIVTFKEGAVEEGIKALQAQSMRTADARDFSDQSVMMEALGDADALVFPEVGAALVGASAAQSRGMSAASELASDDAMEIVEPEYFVFPQGTQDYLRGFLRATETIARDLGDASTAMPDADSGEEVEVLGSTWGLRARRVPPSVRNGLGIKVAVLDTGFAIGHPDFVGRAIVSNTLVGQPVPDLHGHGTHCIGTALGPQAPAGSTPRYGIAFRGSIFVGKVLSNTGGSVGGSVLAGMNWAIANGCHLISMSLGGAGPVQAAYTAAGRAALQRGLLIVAAAGNGSGAPTGFPANSPTIMAVASLDPNLRPSSFSNRGKIEIAAPGRDVFSAVPMPRRYATMSGTSMATPACGWLCGAVGADQPGAARHGAVEQAARQRPPAALPGRPGWRRAGAGALRARREAPGEAGRPPSAGARFSVGEVPTARLVPRRDNASHWMALEDIMATTRKAAHKEWVVTPAPDTPAGAARTALAKAGLKVGQVLGEIGVITGHGAADLGAALRRVKGVADVSEQAPIDIGPPDSPVS